MAPHDGPDHIHGWTEPTDKLTRSGFGTFKALNPPYDNWMDAQDIPVYRNIGVRRVQDLPCHRGPGRRRAQPRHAHVRTAVFRGRRARYRR
jgi:hypothetical protein